MTDMDRRAFFSSSLKKATTKAVQYADNKAAKKAGQWFRPPYAINELDFLLACTRCGECISACEFGVLFSLPAKYGSTAFKTPAMDLINKGCHLCTDWPCVAVCEPAALKKPEAVVQVTLQTDENTEVVEDKAEPVDNSAPPKMALAKISDERCLPYRGPECGACRSSCKVEGALGWDLTKPVINPVLCCGCGLCRQACITDPSSIMIHTLLPE
ncbi:MAG: hypothetical protein CL388_07685 [Acidiferrobacteraceae bacterium]|nr:hypothetical protein [Acidiferrobacteraceae bacterium]|tara:strand:- start:17938 stop:18579 length:642 start_codon:yes stop_codon:yes gene_type:complete